jgi:hypothetical protein
LQAALVEVLAQNKARSTHWKDRIMTKSISASEQGLLHYRVRVVLPNALLHLSSWTEPKIDQDLTRRVAGDWIDDHPYRETIGLINWEAITWRWTE